MLDAVEPTNGAAWTQWKALHHQVKDLSPWLTEGVRAEHLRLSNRKEPSASAAAPKHTSAKRRRCKVVAVLVAICRSDTFSTAVVEILWSNMFGSRQVYAF